MDVFSKQPNDVLDYDVDLTDWFADIADDDIESVEITVTSTAEPVPALVLGPVPHNPYTLLGASPQRFKLWLGGGTHFVDYVVTCVVRTEQDRVKEVEFKIKVRDR
ncbi:MAG TPA: hypothetical protein DEQ55_19830 [Pseudomonas sp.]|jgi:hypothetical protein|nr:hypothetical protein [Pseudomonas sp.]|tara:strand:- start:837 stop:1154 length:318 start_codon:yes stop_codon:yes gene_type:complete